MASSLKDSVIHWRKKLDRTSDTNVILSVIHKLSKVKMTLDILQDTGIAKVIRSLAKHDGKIGGKASAVLTFWRKVVVNAQHESKEPKVHRSKHHSSHNDSKRNTEKSFKIERESESPDKTIHTNHESFNGFKDKQTNDKPTQGVKKEHKQQKHVDRFKDEYSKTINKANSQDSHNPTAKDDSRHKLTNGSKEEHKSSNRKRKSDDVAKTIASVPDDICSNHSDDLKLEDDSCENSNAKRRKLFDMEENGESQEYIGSFSEEENPPHKKEKHKSKDEKNKSKKHKSNREDLKKTSEKLDGFTASEISFEDFLNFSEVLPVKKKKSKKDVKQNEKKTEKKQNEKKIETKQNEKKTEKKQNEKKTEKKQNEKKTESKQNEKKSENKQNEKKSENKQIEKTEDKGKKKFLPPPPPDPLELEISTKDQFVSDTSPFSSLPQPLTNYRPLPHRHYDALQNTKKVLTNEDAIKFISSKREKTCVYSGKKNLYYTEVPKLQDACIRVLIDHIDEIGYLGVLPYCVMSPLYEKCNPRQLYNLEHYNPMVLEDTQKLWQDHCKRDFRTEKPKENETWRDLYWRAFEERETKLMSLTRTISKQVTKNQKSNRYVKLAYVDAVVKPPRDVARKQAKHGTAAVVNHSIVMNHQTENSSASIKQKIIRPVKPEYIKPQKPKVAPLMAKTLKSMKQCFRR